MKKALLLVALAALMITASAGASKYKPWYLHSPGESGKYVCDRNPHHALGTFETKAACTAAIPTDGGGGGGDDGGGDNPPPVVIGPSRGPDSDFLCSNAFQTTPGVWTQAEALTLVNDFGYTEAQAVVGNVDGGNNLGAYHLVCNSGLTDTGLAVGAGGELYGADYGPANTELGFYALYA